MINIVDDIATLTTIPKFTLSKLISIANSCISHAVIESMNDNSDTCEIDIGIGYLIIDITNSDLRFRFEPNNSLQRLIINSIETKQSDLVTEVEKSLKDKILNTYKDLL